jgi:peptidoglycan/LPS O-acetylase OafA/YrhL
VTWTLEVEVQFYCLAPVLALVYRIRSAARRRLLLACCIAGAGVMQLLWWEAPIRVRLSLLFAIQFFLTGFLLADLYVSDWKRSPGKHWVWDAAALACWPAIFLPTDRTVWAWLPALMLLAVCAAFRGPLGSRLISLNGITIVGGMCYSIYLFHYVLIPPVLHAIRLPFALHLALYCGATLLVSATFFVLIERPCMRPDWPGRLRARLAGRKVRAAAG